MPSCQRCETVVDSNWHFCPNCGQTIISTEISLGDENAVSEHALPPLQGQYGKGVRGQVIEVIIRQALKGAAWREICSGPMLVNQITEGEIEDELRRRQGDDDGKQPARVPKKPDRR